MPSRPDTIDERFEEIVAQLQGASPRAPRELRERVRALAAEPAPVRERSRRPRWALVLAPAMLLAIVVGAAVADRTSRDRAVEEAAVTAPVVASKRPARSREDTQEHAQALRGAPAGDSEARSAGGEAAGAFGAAPAPQGAVPPSRARLQDYRVDLRVRVRDRDELSRATAQAMRTARSLRGFVVQARYDTPRGEDADSLLVVRVPVTRVQDAIARFSQLGVIVSQRIAVDDLQQSFNRETERIRALLRTIASLQRELRRPDLTDEQRAELRFRLANARAELQGRTVYRQELVRRGRLARISLALTTREAPPAPPQAPGKFEQTLRDALSVLGTIVTWLVAGLIVAAPFLLLAALAVALERRRRRAAEERLLARPAP